MARAADVPSREIEEPRRRVAFDAGQDPDGIAAGLAIQAAGAGAVPVAGGRPPEDLGRTTWARVDGTSEPLGEPPETLVLPAALSPLERTPPQPLELDPAAVPGSLDLPGVGEVSPAAVMSAARRLGERLPSHRGRPILCATPDAAPLTTQVIQAWTLLSDAAWVLEPLAGAFVPTALWARPTLACGSASELEELAEPLRERKHRRHHRLRAVLLLGGRELAPAASEIFRVCGISIVRLTPKAVQSWTGT